MDFESPDVEKDFPGLYASESGRKSNESDFSDGAEHEKPSKKDLLGRRKDKKESKKDRGYAALAGESSPEEDTDTKSPSKSKKTKSFKFPTKSKEKREKSRDKEKGLDDISKQKELIEKEKKKEKEREKEREKEKKEKEKKERLKEKDKEKEEKAKSKLESKEKCKDDKKEKVKEKEKEKVKEKEKDKKDKKLTKVPSTVTSGVPFEEIFTLGVALPIFGVPLHQSVERSRCHDDTGLPLVVRDAIDYLQAYGLKSNQIYRAEPDKIKLQQLRKLYTDREETFLYHWDVPVACAILKAFISELPESILTQELHGQLEQTTAMAEPQREVAATALLSRLPPPNRMLLAWLVRHFESVVQQEQINHVNALAIANAMGPALNMTQNLLTYLISKAEKLFPDVELTKYVPPLQSIPTELGTPEEMARELRKQESLLNQIHAEMHAGFITPARDQRLWEAQRIVTQLKRKLRTVQKPIDSSMSQQQPSIDEKPPEDEPAPSTSQEPTSRAHSVDNKQTDGETNNEKPTSATINDAFQPEQKSSESPQQKTEPKKAFSDEAFEDNFDFNTNNNDQKNEPSESQEPPQPPAEPKPDKPKLTEKEIKLLRLQLENAEYLQLKSLLQAKINSEQFEIVKLRSHVALKNKQEGNVSNLKDNKENYTPEEIEFTRQRLMKENAMLEQKRISLINQIFQERVACIQLKIELAMKEIL